tara:strand:- start:208 stop:579 length:372 start_codon:yes stop_codon:yes gene_type:complete
MVISKFNEQTKILESHFKNNIHLKDVLDYIIATKENTSYPRTLKILTNAKHASFKFSFNDLNAIISENNKSLEKYDAIIDAIIIDSPETAALTVLYQELAKNKKYHFDVFSTEEAALIWLETF